MIVKMNVSISGMEFSYYFGQIVMVDDDLAQKWLSVGHAVPVTNDEISAYNLKFGMTGGAVNDTGDSVGTMGKSAGNIPSEPTDNTIAGASKSGTSKAASKN